MILIQKIQAILDGYKSIGAQLWHIGTDFYKSYMRLINNIKSCNFASENFPTTLTVKKVFGIDKEKYTINIDNRNITPTTKKDRFASHSTIRQYLQEGSSLSFIFYSDEDKIADSLTLDISSSMWELISNDFNKVFVNALINAMKRSINSSIYYERNLGYTLFICLIDEYDQTVFRKIKNHQIIGIKQFRNNYVEISSPIGIAYIKKVKGYQKSNNNWGGDIVKEFDQEPWKGKYTYLTCCSKIKERYTFEQIINVMYEQLIGEINSINYQNKISTNNGMEQLIQIINQSRTKIRRSTAMNRGYIDENKSYTDFKGSELNNIRFKDLDACHIYDIEKIKVELRESFSQGRQKETFPRLLELSKNHNNCLFMNPLCHRMFDRLEIWFNNDGKLCYRHEIEKWVKMFFGDDVNNIRIKPEILTEEMKDNLKKKISNIIDPIIQN